MKEMVMDLKAGILFPAGAVFVCSPSLCPGRFLGQPSLYPKSTGDKVVGA